MADPRVALAVSDFAQDVPHPGGAVAQTEDSARTRVAGCYLVYLNNEEPWKQRLKNIDLCDQKTAR
jgi:hypothetical protein